MSCNLCGGESGKFFLCFKCNKLKEEGKAIKCDKCGKWHYVNKSCSCSQSERVTEKAVKLPPVENGAAKKTNESGLCIVCGESAPNGFLCRDCYYEMRDYRETFDKNSKVFDMRDYYFNLRSNIYRMKTFDYIKSNCNKLMAIATFVLDLFKDGSLYDRVVADIKEIIESKKPKEEKQVSEEVKQRDSHKEELLRTSDGHYVKSTPEVIIDDLLYDNRIVHCYEKKVPINADEQTVKCDWFIPVKSKRDGIFIEYWGMNTREYLDNKERKRKAYREHNIPLIEIEKDDYKDPQGLEDRIISELNSLAKRYYGVEKFI